MCIHPEHLGLFSRGKPDVFRMYVHNVKREQFHICQTYNPQISNFIIKQNAMFKRRYV